MGACVGLPMAAWLSGCAAVDTRSVFVEVRDTATQTGIDGAVLRATGLNPVHPLRVSDYLRARPDEYPPGRTDAGGRSRMTVPSTRPFQLTVILPGLTPATVFFNDGLDAVEVPSEWIGLPVPPGVGGVEYRLVPP